MTTKITVNAHAEWPVAVYAVDRYRGSVKQTFLCVVAPNTSEDFYATSTREILAIEIGRPDYPASDPAYRPLDFGDVVRGLKAGKRFARAGWNGKAMWIAMQAGSTIMAGDARGGAAACRANETGMTSDSKISILPHIDMRSADGSIVVGWLASQTDMLAEDWVEVTSAP